MRINHNSKTVDMERRDIEYILPAYVRQYLMYMQNEDPDCIVFPMLSSVPHPHKPGVSIPIQWVPELDQIAVEIAQDGSEVTEMTETEVAQLDKKDANEMSPAKKAFAPKPDRTPKIPEGGEIGPGSSLDGMGSRNPKADAQIRRDLLADKPIDEDAEVPFDKEVSRDKDGKPVVGDAE